MRFVVVCSDGHLGDVDWYFWAHRNVQQAKTGQCSRTTAKMYFNTSGASGGDFNAMSIKCECGASSTFEGLTDRPYRLGCGGKQPWQDNNDAIKCKADTRVHPRSASNVYYHVPLSSFDIASEELLNSMGQESALLKWLQNYPPALAVRQAALMLGEGWRENKKLYQHIIDDACRQFGLATSIVEPMVLGFLCGKNNDEDSLPVTQDISQHGILVSEWPYLVRPNGMQTRYLRTRPVMLSDHWPQEYTAVWDQVTLIDRLREVRAMLGFRRLRPDADSKLVPVDLGKGESWLPGVDLFGEGIFIKFNENHLSKWEREVSAIMAQRMGSLKKKCARWGREPAGVYASTRFIALHTFAHGFIRRLSFDAGYSSSSIRERIYCNLGIPFMAGILVYTSDSDSEGSLGGLVRQGEPARLLQTIRRTLADLSWCSGDPVCSELENQGIDSMNAAACHACCLLSETSCTFNNSLLDRRMLIGARTSRIKGLLEHLI